MPGLEESLSDRGLEGLHKQIRSDNENKANKTRNPPVATRVVSDDKQDENAAKFYLMGD